MTELEKVHSGQFNASRKNTQQYNNPLRGRSVLRSGGPNHVNPHVHHVSSIAASSRGLSLSNYEPEQAALVVVLVEVS
jgi:hypothetical protein